MSCAEGKRTLPAYLDGTLDEAGTLQWEEHLKICGDCRELHDLWRRLGELPEVVPDSSLPARFERALAAEIGGASPRPGSGLARWLATAASVTLLVAAGWFAGRWTPAGENFDNAGVAELRREVATLRTVVTLGLLAQPSASERLKGINYAERSAEPSREVISAIVAALKFDSNVNVRLAACDALKTYASVPGVRRALLEALGSEESPLVKVSLIEALADLGEQRSAGALARLASAHEEDDAVREEAAAALQKLQVKGATWKK